MCGCLLPVSFPRGAVGCSWHFLFILMEIKKESEKNSFKNTIGVSNGSDPDQARCFNGPDLSPNCLQWLSADVLSRY